LVMRPSDCSLMTGSFTLSLPWMELSVRSYTLGVPAHLDCSTPTCRTNLGRHGYLLRQRFFPCCFWPRFCHGGSGAATCPQSSRTPGLVRDRIIGKAIGGVGDIFLFWIQIGTRIGFLGTGG
jgi:hypothetical protein